jgi:hypothetical protein
MIPITMIDITGLQTVREVIDDLRTRGIEFIAAGRAMEWKLWAESRRLESGWRSFPTLRAAIKAYKRENGPLRDVRKTA